mmetsp:Transcript_20722/g.44179  ORF Transcript_20722/g.44179 Transcript_20722/m.44179 type:complete len:268 (-) Transcript_20722:190-993(-)
MAEVLVRIHAQGNVEVVVHKVQPLDNAVCSQRTAGPLREELFSAAMFYELRNVVFCERLGLELRLQGGSCEHGAGAAHGEVVIGLFDHLLPLRGPVGTAVSKELDIVYGVLRRTRYIFHAEKFEEVLVLLVPEPDAHMREGTFQGAAEASAIRLHVRVVQHHTEGTDAMNTPPPEPGEHPVREICSPPYNVRDFVALPHVKLRPRRSYDAARSQNSSQQLLAPMELLVHVVLGMLIEILRCEGDPALFSLRPDRFTESPELPGGWNR